MRKIKFILYIIPLLQLSGLNGQEVRRIWELDTPESGSLLYNATERISFLQGYSYESSGGSVELSAYTDEDYMLDAEYLNFDSIDDNFEQGLGYMRDLNQNLAIGSTAGSFNVTPGGAATYTIPVAIPPGTSGIQPQLAISYNSQSGNGILGWGWHLSGLSVITRTGKTLYHDDEIAGVKFDNNDNFILDGQRLIKITGTHGADGATYATEQESFSVIILHDPDGMYGPDYFTVETKDGSTLYYGKENSSDQQVTNLRGVVAWYLNRVEDPLGNYIDYTYEKDNDNGEIWLVSIDYTGNTVTSQQPYNQVKFFYDIRTDVEERYINGYKFTNSKLLRKIKTYSEGEMIKEYRPVYYYPDAGDNNYNFNNPVTFLHEIEEYNGIEEKYNSIFVGWGLRSRTKLASEDSDKERHYQTSTQQDVIPINLLYKTAPGDFNGDGRSDLMRINFNYDLEENEYTLFTNTSTYLKDGDDDFSFTESDSFKIEINTIDCGGAFPGDFNADGNTDILLLIKHEGSKSFRYYKSNGDNFKETSLYITPDFNFNTDIDIHIADFDGDGKSELLVQGVLMCRIYHIYEDIDGNDFLWNAQYNVPKPRTGGIIERSWRDLSIFSEQYTDTYCSDFNGDSRADIITIYGDLKIYDANDETLLYQRNDVSMNDDNYFTDFNGDGIVDLLTYSVISGWRMFAGNGLSFIQVTAPGLPGIKISEDNDYGMLTGDFNSDGKSDILITHTDQYDITTWSFYYSKGFTFTTPKTEQATWVKTKYFSFPGLIDFNGDGIVDIAYTQGTSIGSGTYIVLMNQKTEKRLVTRIYDGMNTQLDIRYQRPCEINSGIYTPGSVRQYPVSSVPIPVPLVSSIRKRIDDPPYYLTLENKEFVYEDNKIHLGGKGNLGFTKFIVENNTQNTTYSEYYEYNDDYFYPYLKTKSYYTGATLTMRESSTNNVKEIIAGKTYWPYHDQSIKYDYLHDNKVISNYTLYDNSGNLKNSNVEYRGDLSSTMGTGILEASVQTINNYTAINSTYDNKLLTSQVTQSRPGETDVIRSSRFTYYGSGLPDETFQDEGTVYEVSSQNFYNSYGNLTRKELDGYDITTTRFTEFGYDDYYRYPVTMTNAFGQIIQKAYDPGTGNVISEISPTGITTIHTYDYWGRLIKTETPFNIANTEFTWGNSPQAPDALYYIKTQKETGEVSFTYYDKASRKCHIKTLNGLGGYYLYSNIVYNAQGRIESMEDPHRLNETAAEYRTTFEYDDYGRKVRSYGHGFDMATGYDKNIVADTNNLYTAETSWGKYNSLGEIIQAHDKGGDIIYEYDAAGNLKEVTSPSGTITMQYDLQGNQTVLNDPNAGQTTYGYNVFGELVEQTDANTNTFTMAYDVLGRLTWKDNADEGKTYYEYVTSGNGLGAIKRIWNDQTNISQEYTYDMYGNTTRMIEKIDGTGYTYNYGYDNHGRMILREYPEDFAVSYTYNLYNEMVQANIQDGDMIWQLLDYNSRGQVTSVALGNNVTKTYGYDTYGMPEMIRANNGIENIQYLSFVFDPNRGNLTSRTDHLANSGSGISESFGYDNNLNILTSYTVGAQTYTMTYDNPTGNITNKSDIGDYTQYGISSGGPNAVTEVDDIYGVISDEAQEIEYTAFNKTDNIEQNDKYIEFTYGVNQERKISYFTQGSTELTKIYAGGLFEKEIDENSNERRLYYITGPTGTEAIYVKDDIAGDEMFYIHKDYLGSYHTISDENGDIALINSQKQVYAFDPWGRRRDPDTWQALSAIPANLLFDRGFTGHEHLDAFVLINMNGRVYDPILGRFLTLDNFVQMPDFSQNFNRYTYCLNNPLVYTDPTGEFWHLVIPAVIGGTMNTILNAGKIDNFWEGLGYFGVGAAASFIGGAVSSGISSASAIGGSFNAGVISYVSGVQTMTSTGAICGALSGAAGGAISGALLGGGNSAIQGDNFWNGAKTGAISGAFGGALSGGYQGGKNALRQGKNVWWGTEPEDWAYNRNQWSLGWKNKPDKIVFKDVKNRGAGRINCMAKCFQDMYGNTEQHWDTYTNSGLSDHTLQNIRAGGGQAMIYPGNHSNVTYNEILNLNASGGRAMINLENYRNSGFGHSLAVKKILYVPNSRFDAVVFDPYYGGRLKIRNFNKGTTLGQNLRIWFINL